jgi:hypothetical protein
VVQPRAAGSPGGSASLASHPFSVIKNGHGTMSEIDTLPAAISMVFIAGAP